MIIVTCTWKNLTARSIPVRKNNTRSFSLNNLYKYFYDFFKPQPPKPPYKHICQVGDPVLRGKAKPVEVNEIRSEEFQKSLNCLTEVLRRYDSCGLAAPQIGIPQQFFAIEFTEGSLKTVEPEIIASREIESIPLTFFINPVVKIKDHTPILFPEVCASIHGYQAIVPRAREVEITALDRLGETFTLSAKGWLARMIQHEYDHLQGKFYTDKMDASTLSCCIWQEVNKYRGHVKILFRPR